MGTIENAKKALGGFYNKADVNELLVQEENYDLTAFASSTLVANYGIDKLNAANVIDTAGNYGTLVTGGIGAFIDVVLPYMVVIGDSIAEGRLGLHGRLNVGDLGGYTPSHISAKGQINYELAKSFNMPVINQGIGGQTSVAVRARWNRDVMAVDTAVGDGRPNSTLEFGGQKPVAVYVHVGVNDIAQSVPLATIKDNLYFFAQSCQDNNVKLLMANIGAYSGYTAQWIADATEINTWIANTLAIDFPEVEIIDYLNWSSGGTNVYTDNKLGMIEDGIHPFKDGYQDYSGYLIKNLRTAISVDKIVLNSASGGTTAFQRTTGFTLNGESFTLPNVEVAEITLGALTDIDTPIYRIEATGVTTVTGTTYTGWASIWAKMKGL